MKKMAKKSMTIEDLAQVVVKGFENVDKRFDSMAVAIAKSFENAEKEMTEIKSDLNEVKKDVKDNKANIVSTRGDILNMSDRFPSQFAFDNLSARVYNLEQKKKSKA